MYLDNIPGQTFRGFFGIFGRGSIYGVHSLAVSFVNWNIKPSILRLIYYFSRIEIVSICVMIGQAFFNFEGS
jgi:hypothetical protein